MRRVEVGDDREFGDDKRAIGRVCFAGEVNTYLFEGNYGQKCKVNPCARNDSDGTKCGSSGWRTGDRRR